MVIMDRNKKDLVIPKSLGNFVTEGGSGGGITPEEAAEIASAVTETAIDEYDTELQVELEEIRDAISGNTDTLLDLAEIAAMGIAERVALFDEIYEKASNGEKIYIKGLVQEETIRTAILPLVSYRPETNPVLHQGGNLYFAAKGDTDNVYFHIGLTSEGSVDPTSGNIIKRNIYNLPTASAEVKGGVRVGSGLTMTQDTLSLDTTGLVTDGDLAPFIVQQSANTENIASLSAATEAISDSLGNYATTATTNELATAISGVSESLGNYATTAVTDSISTAVSGITDSLSNYATTATTDALSAVTSALTEDVAGKQDELTAGNGIDLSGNTIYVKIGEGLAFSGDTLVVSGGSSNTKVVFLNKLTQQERVDLYNELSALYDYDANGWSSAYTEDMYAFYLDLRSHADQDAAQTADRYEGFYPMECCRMHPTDYGGAAFFTGVEQSREGNGQLICIRLVIDYEGNVDGPSTWWNNPPGEQLSIATVTFGNDWRGGITYIAGSDMFYYGNGNIATGDTQNYVEDLIDYNYLTSLFSRNGKYDNFYLINVHSLNVVTGGTTYHYTAPTLSKKSITAYTIGDYTFENEVTFKYADWELKIDIATGSNIGANLRIAAL